VALADIVRRIDGDATDEAGVIVARAQEEAERSLAEAREQAQRAKVERLERARRDSEAEAETLKASARLAARDQLVAAKRQLMDRVLVEAQHTIASLDDDAYADLVARRIVAAARGGERVLMAPQDVSRLASRLPAAVSRINPELRLVWASQAAPVERGVVLQGDRVSVDLSLASLIEERRDELSMLAAEMLFGGAGD